MHNLRIEGRKIFLDGFEVKDVNGYELKVNGEEQGAELTLKLIVQDEKVKPKPFIGSSGALTYADTLATVGGAGPEVVNPLAKLEEMLQRHFSHDVVIKVDNQELGLAAVKAINEVQRSAGRTLLPTKATEDTAALVKVIKNEMDWLKAVIAYAKRSNVDSDQFRQLLSKQEDSLYFYSQLLQSFESSPGD